MADAKPQAGGAGASQDGAGPAKTGQDDLDPSILAAMGQANSAIGGAKDKASAGGGSVDQAGIDALLTQAAQDSSAGGTATDEDIEKMLASAGAAQAAGTEAAAGGGGGGARAAVAPAAPKFDLPSFAGAAGENALSSIDLLRDVELNVKIELGRSRMLVEDVLRLGEGSVVELDKLAGDPVDVFVNDRLVARGEVLVLNDNFCVRVNEIVAGIREDVL